MVLVIFDEQLHHISLQVIDQY